MRPGGLAASLAAVLIAATSTSAQERAPAQRQALVDLARVLGESHAIRQACEGPQDQYWRTRMQRLLAVEAADQGLKTRISVAFNAGYGSGKALYSSCTEAARAQARQIARTAQALTETLAKP